jgi:hypothetical protein
MQVSDDIKTAYRGLFVIVTLGVLLLVITSVVRSCSGKDVEGWMTYKRGPDNSIRTGIDGYYPDIMTGMNGLQPSAPAFYLVPEYRLPYDWPRGFQTNYPVPHVEPLVALN